MKIEKFKLLLAVNAAFDTLVERGQDFDATAVKDLFQRSMETQMTLLRMTDRICEDFEKIRDVRIPAWRTTHILARDLFLFACYTGTAYADAVSVTRENLYTDDEGSLWLKYRRKKNELRSSVSPNWATRAWFLLIISLIATLDLVVQPKSNGSVRPFAFNGFDDAHHILRHVKHLLVNLRIGQRAVVAQRLQDWRKSIALCYRGSIWRWCGSLWCK